MDHCKQNGREIHGGRTPDDVISPQIFFVYVFKYKYFILVQ